MKYNGMTVKLYFDGGITIYNFNDEIEFEGSLLNSSDFKKKMLVRINDKEN